MQVEARTEGQTSASTGHPAEPQSSDQTDIAAQAPAARATKTTVIPNFSRVLSPANDPPMASRTRSRSARRAGAMRNTTRQEKVKRWEGKTKTVGNWDGLRRDSELWFEDADCLVHLYARGQSRRGPSFRVPFRTLQKNHCDALFSLCFAQMTPTNAGSNMLRRTSNGAAAPTDIPSTCELYIPAPDNSSREDSFQWHVATRNFFAFIFGKPLVGAHLGKSLIDLQERMHLFRSGQTNNHEDFMAYAEKLGYLNFVNCPDYALAMLHYAERYQLQELWIDAFAHCVGMNDNLCLSTEFEPISRVTKALITRAYLEMDLHLGRVMAALSNFLEDDFSSAYLGLSQGARAHLDRFRSFLHSFYVEKFGYWPPPEGSCFSKALYRSMYFDFRSLYDYLVDMESSDSIQSQKLASGGICVLQNVQAFDKRHKNAPLPHPLPRIPEDIAPHNRTQSQRALVAFKLGSKQARTDRYMTTRAALTAATNAHDISVTSSPLVMAYMRFERECAVSQREEKVSIADARKVRWLLIYGVLQMLISAMRAPKEVRDTEEPTYPLCCLITGTPPWKTGTKALKAPVIPSTNAPEEVQPYHSRAITTKGMSQLSTPITPIMNIQPDCEAGDYFTHKSNSPDTGFLQRQLSVEVPAPLRISSPILRNASIRSIKAFSFSPFSSRRNSVVIKPPSQPFCEIIVHGYGNGLNQTILDPPTGTSSPSLGSPLRILTPPPVPPKEPQVPEQVSQQLTATSASQSSKLSHPENTELHFDPIPEIARTPILEAFQIDQMYESSSPEFAEESSSSSASMPLTPIWSSRASSTSSASSAGPVNCTEGYQKEVGALGGLVLLTSPSSKHPPTPASPTSTGLPITSRRGTARFSPSDVPAEVSAGPKPTVEESNIGIALAPPDEVQFTIANEKFTAEEKSKILVRKSFSVESFTLVKKSAEMDIYSALRMLPAHTLDTGLTRIELSSDDEDTAAPSPIVKMPNRLPPEQTEKAKVKQKRLSLRLMGRGKSEK